MAKEQQRNLPKLGKIPQKRNSMLNPNCKDYDPVLAKRRQKEKNRRKADSIRRQRER